MLLEGATTIITGASRGIGAAVARAAAAEGARVGLIARSKSDLEEVLASCRGSGAIAAADATDRDAVQEAIAALERELGPTAILVNNAGAGAYGTILDTDVEVFEQLIRVNYFSAVYATKAVLPGMVDRRAGHICMLGSIVARIGAPLEAAYSASKFAMAGLTEALALEVANKGIGVSMIDPGPVQTNFFDARGVPYMRSTPKPVSAEAVATAVIAAIERGKGEAFIPRWLRFPVIIKTLMPSAYRMGALRQFRKDLS